VGRTVLVTGANSGLGLATVLELARLGFRSVGSVRSGQKAELVHRAAAAAGRSVETVLLDVNDEEACADVVGRLAPLHGLVNNAGYSVTGAVEDVADHEARAVLETMVIAPMRLARLALPGMREVRDGCIINVSSIYGRTSTPFTGWYQAAKHALEGVTDALRMEVAGFGVRVSLVEPGGFRTAIFDEVSGDVARREGSPYQAGYQRSLDLLRLATPFLGNPDQVARLVGRILRDPHPRARYLVGIDAQAAALAGAATPTFVRDLVTRKVLGL
jgi:NAD(P)-dependent dehydrogenase (short-subunit alcohol dehydrogenase family)